MKRSSTTECHQTGPRRHTPRSNLGTIYYMKNDVARAREEWEAATAWEAPTRWIASGYLFSTTSWMSAHATGRFTQQMRRTETGLMIGDVLRGLNATAGADGALRRGRAGRA